MKFSLNIIESSSDIQKEIINAIVKQLQRPLNNAVSSIKKELQKMVKEAIEAEPEYQQLISGRLQSELGIDRAGRVNAIVDIWSNNIDVKNQPLKSTNNGITGKISFEMIKSDYSDVLSSPEATITDRASGEEVPWLYWLLLGGGGILVQDYIIQYTNSKKSRSGKAIMVKSMGRNWRMPAKFVGTAKNNWVYRAISRVESKIPDMIKSQLEKAI